MRRADLYRHLILIERPGHHGTAGAPRRPGSGCGDHAMPRASRPSQQADSLNGCVEAEVTWQDRLVHLLSLERILLAEEQQALAELGRQAQNRLGEWAVPA